MRRLLAWLLTLPLTAAGVLCAHALAYAALGASGGGLHAYLAHAPQLGAVLATVSLVALVHETRAGPAPAWPFAAFALVAFAAQEHAERLVHTGELPWLLPSPVFLAGLALQLPFALAAWLLARWLLRLRGGRRSLPPALPRLLLPLVEAGALRVPAPAGIRPAGRGPPPSS